MTIVPRIKRPLAAVKISLIHHPLRGLNSALRAPPLRLQAGIKKSEDANEGVRSRFLVDTIVGDLPGRGSNGMQFVVRPIEVVNGAIVDFDLHWRAGCSGGLDSLDAWRRLDRIHPARQFPARTGCRASNPSKAANTTPGKRRRRRENRPSANRLDERRCWARWRKSQFRRHATSPSLQFDPRSRKTGPASTEGRHRRHRTVRPSPNPPFAICGHVARTETVGKQHDVRHGMSEAAPTPPRARRARRP